MKTLTQRKRRNCRWSAVGSLLLLALVSTEAQTQIYAKFEGGGPGINYTSDAENPVHRGDPGWIALESFSLGVENTVNIGGGGGGGAGRASFKDITIGKTVNSASAALFQTCVMGRQWDEAEINLVMQSGGGFFVAMKIELKLVMVQSITSSSVGEQPVETVVLKHGAHRITFYQTDPDTGQIIESGQTAWNIVTNTDEFDVSP